MNTPKLKVGDTVFINDSYHADDGHPIGTVGVIIEHRDQDDPYSSQLFRLNLPDKHGDRIKSGFPQHYTKIDPLIVALRQSLPKGFNKFDLLNLASDLEAQPAFINGGKEDGKRVQIESNAAFAARFIRAVLENNNAHD